MTSCYITMGHATSTRYSVMWFMSRPQQLPFAKMALLVPRALTVSQVSVTKAGGLSDAPGAERSPYGKNGDTVTLSPRLMPAPSTAFI